MALLFICVMLIGIIILAAYDWYIYPYFVGKYAEDIDKKTDQDTQLSDKKARLKDRDLGSDAESESDSDKFAPKMGVIQEEDEGVSREEVIGQIMG